MLSAGPAGHEPLVSSVQLELWVCLLGRSRHVGQLAGLNIGRPGWGVWVPVEAGPSVLSHAEWRHHPVFGVSPGFGLGRVQLEPLGLVGRIPVVPGPPAHMLGGGGILKQLGGSTLCVTSVLAVRGAGYSWYHDSPPFL